MRILQLNASDIKGGAAAVAWRIHTSLNLGSNSSFIAVNYKFSKDKNVILINNDKCRNIWFQIFNQISNFSLKFSWNLSRFFIKIANPKFFLFKTFGKEYFDFNGFKEIVNAINPDIIHAHVLHGDFADLSYIAKISNKIPVVITLHDAWLLSGHCAHSFDCDKWITGCGNCPDLSIRPAIKKDATNFNWNQKKQFYSNAAFTIITPCDWLMNKVDKSILIPSIIEKYVIPNGIDLELFKPRNKYEARQELGIDSQKKVILFASNGIQNNIWKDFETLKKAIKIISEQRNEEVLLLAIGEKLDTIKYNNCEIEFKSFVSETEMISFFQAADIYVHPANADTFPTTILEALACGLPIVATNVCGIPEQIKGFKNNFIKEDKFNTFEKNLATGILVNKKSPNEVATAIQHILFDDELRNKLSENARNDAEKRFDLKSQIDNYIKIYKRLTKN